MSNSKSGGGGGVCLLVVIVVIVVGVVSGILASKKSSDTQVGNIRDLQGNRNGSSVIFGLNSTAETIPLLVEYTQTYSGLILNYYTYDSLNRLREEYKNSTPFMAKLETFPSRFVIKFDEIVLELNLKNGTRINIL